MRKWNWRKGRKINANGQMERGGRNGINKGMGGKKGVENHGKGEKGVGGEGR